MNQNECPLNNGEVCPTCGVTKRGDEFYTSYGIKIGLPPMSSDAFYTKVCRHVPDKPCINPSETVDPKYDFNNVTL